MCIFSFLVASTQHLVGKLRRGGYCFTFRAYWGTSHLREHKLPVSRNLLCHMQLVRTFLAPPRVSGTLGVTSVLLNAL